MRLRQVALVARELAPVRHQLFSLFGLDSDFKDAGVGEFGLENSVMVIGDKFLEVVSPVKEGTTAGRQLEKQGGDGGYMILCQVEDIESYRQRTLSLKVRKVWETDQEKTKAFHLHPKDMGAAIVSLDWMKAWDDWAWGGPGWRQRRATNVSDILGVDVRAQAPAALASRWARVFGETVLETTHGLTISLDEGDINFVQAAPTEVDGICAITLQVSDMAKLAVAADDLKLPIGDNRIQVAGITIHLQH